MYRKFFKKTWFIAKICCLTLVRCDCKKPQSATSPSPTSTSDTPLLGPSEASADNESSEENPHWEETNKDTHALPASTADIPGSNEGLAGDDATNNVFTGETPKFRNWEQHNVELIDRLKIIKTTGQKIGLILGRKAGQSVPQ